MKDSNTKSKKSLDKEVKEKTEKKTKEELDEEIKENTKRAARDMFSAYIPYLIIIFFVVIIRIFIATPVRVNGTSMYPTLHNGDIMILYKLKLKTVGIKRFDVVVIDTDQGDLIKRVIGLPGDKIKYESIENEDGTKTGKLYVNGKVVKEDFLEEKAKFDTCYVESDICEGEIEVPEDEYYVMGDNRGNSKDSRIIGPVSIDDITGITELRIFPFDRIKNIKK